jgi:hypothetical protein
MKIREIGIRSKRMIPRRWWFFHCGNSFFGKLVAYTAARRSDCAFGTIADCSLAVPGVWNVIGMLMAYATAQQLVRVAGKKP